MLQLQSKVQGQQRTPMENTLGFIEKPVRWVEPTPGSSFAINHLSWLFGEDTRIF